MARRHDKLRRDARRERGSITLNQAVEPFDRAEALARWTSKMATMTGRGFSIPPFRSKVLGPLVHVDLDGDDPPGELRERTLVGTVRLTQQQLPS